ncbi:MAG: AAA family ATPase [Magnetococcus sp. YQC-5]
MRLRYLWVRHPPLRDFAVAFSDSAPWEVFVSVGETVPDCAIHFVIGLNGSGKSHLLRALAEVFLALADRRLPGFPVSLIYELGRPGDPEHRTLIFDHPGEKHLTSLWLAEGWRFSSETDQETFAQAVELLRRTKEHTVKFGGAIFSAKIPRGSYPQAAPYALPRAVLAYTSGDLLPWQKIWQVPTDSTGVDSVTQDEEYDTSRERPPDWTSEDESRVVIDGGTFGDDPRTVVDALEMPVPHMFRRPILLEGVTLTCALLAVVLQEEMRIQKGAKRNKQLANLFEKAGWLHLIGVRLRINLDRARQAPRALLPVLHDLLLAAAEVIREPHPVEPWRALYLDIDGPAAREGTEFLETRMEGITTQGQALYALLGEPNDSTFERFGRLLQWSNAGLLDDLELFLRREKKPTEDVCAPDAGVLCFSELSDGERMVLSRWALFHLLAGQDDALLLLDEPETHFNDTWKREIVSVIDAALGQDASAVLIATHSAIVLSDIFDEEIILIEKFDNAAHAKPIGSRTFATDPSALMMTVFGADDSIGQRAMKRIEAFVQEAGIKTDPTPDDVRRLQAIISRLGTGFYRSELKTLLNRWKEYPDLRTIEQVIPTLQSDMLKDELRAILLRVQPPGEEGGGDD